jgi:hypothetical protein
MKNKNKKRLKAAYKVLEARTSTAQLNISNFTVFGILKGFCFSLF